MPEPTKYEHKAWSLEYKTEPETITALLQYVPGWRDNDVCADVFGPRLRQKIARFCGKENFTWRDAREFFEDRYPTDPGGGVSTRLDAFDLGEYDEGLDTEDEGVV